jgi:hypothetical protein
MRKKIRKEAQRKDHKNWNIKENMTNELRETWTRKEEMKGGLNYARDRNNCERTIIRSDR